MTLGDRHRHAPATSGAGRIRGAWRRRPVWLLPFAFGVLLTPLVAYAINETRLADAIVGPLVLPDTTGRADAIVVPGAGVTAACSPNLNAIRRTLLAARLWHEGRAPFVLFSGGVPEGVGCSVAAVMADLARVAGVPSDRLLIEAGSRTTWENAMRSAPQLRQRRAQRLLLVTDRLHMARAQASFAHFGFDIERVAVPVYDGHRDNVEMLTHGVREYIGILYYRQAGRIGNPWSVAAGLASPPPAGSLAPAAIQNMPPRVAYPSGPLAILGASYAADWKVATLGGVPVINKGVNGHQSFELLARFDADIVAVRPRAVIIWGFINDIFRTERSRVGQTLEQTRASYRQLVATARAQGIEPVLATEVTIRHPDTLSNNVQALVGSLLRRSSYHDYINDHVLATNRWIRELAQQEGLLLLDLQPALADAPGRRLKAFAVSDGSHISAEGYRAVTDYVDQVLAGRFK